MLHATRSPLGHRSLCGKDTWRKLGPGAGVRAVSVIDFLKEQGMHGGCSNCRRAIQRQGLERSELARRATMSQRLDAGAPIL